MERPRARVALALTAAFLAFQAQAATQPTDYVDPMVGTDAHGHTFPGATAPFGMVQLSPDTRTDTWDGCSGYHYDDTTIQGFSHTHLSGTGCGCLGDILLMPVVGDPVFDAGEPGHGYTSRFSHTQETAKAGYYKVFLKDPKVTAELTATTRTGFHKYTFPASDKSKIVLDLVHGIQNDATETYLHIENPTTISGYRRSNGWGGRRTAFFYLQFSKPFTAAQIQQNGTLLSSSEQSAKGMVKADLDFQTKDGEAIEVKVGISGTGIDEARKNLKAENPGWNFDQVRNQAAAQWNQALGAAEVSSTDRHLLRTFYTNLYLAYVAPNTFNDADGSYLGMDHKVHAGSFHNYTTFSLWDTHRALHPLLTLLQPQRVDDIVQTLLAEYKESGYHSTPIWPLWGNETWCMIGYHSVPVIVDAYLKGFRGFDAEAAYQAMKDTAMQNRSGLDSYKASGWVSSKSGECATSKTLEYGLDDWCLAKMAEALGHTDDAEMFYKRAANYRNVFDGTSQFMRGRKADGSWRAPFDTHGLVNDEYTEADAWQYAFDVPQDVPGMISTYGGDKKFIARLDALFAENSTIHTDIPDISGLIGQYSQGDEQCHHVAYLYDYAGAPWKTQAVVRKVMATQYNDKPDGECGNVDCGQMAAWYVLSALGIYEVNPGSGVYALGSPTVDKAVLHLDKSKYGGHQFTIIAENNSPTNVYIQSATLNGKPLDRCWLSHAEIVAGGTLHLVMGPRPRSGAIVSRPKPTMPSGFRYASLPTPAVDKMVVLSLPIRIVCGSDDPVQDFISDPNMLDGSTNRSDVKVDASAEHAAPAQVYSSERYAQDFTYKFPVPKDKSYTVRLHFAEIFDENPGMRIEDVYLNGKLVIPHLDILKAAGGVDKALVKEFADVKPDQSGDIRIRIKAADGSPDQNAKISGIEILPS